MTASTLKALSAPRWTRFAAAIFVVALAPLCLLGAGTDLDAGSVLYSGRRIVHGGYVASRPPGSPVHETIAGVLDAVFGGWAINLMSLFAAVVLCAAVWLLLAREGVPRPWLAAALVAASPWFQIASTSTVDFVAAAALLVCGALALRHGRSVTAGVLCGLSVGMRISGVLIVIAMIAAEATGDGKQRRRAFNAFVVAAGIGALAFVAPFLAANDSVVFAQNDFRTGSAVSQLGRAVAKNIAYLGPLAVIAVALALPAIWHLRTQWSQRWIVRFATVGFVLSEALFVRFPWKMGHLIPAMMCLALLLAEALRDRRVLFITIVIAQLAIGVVNVELLRPDVPNSATRASITFRVRPGPLVVDTLCRLDDRDAARSRDVTRTEAVWNCAKPWGTGR